MSDENVVDHSIAWPCLMSAIIALCFVVNKWIDAKYYPTECPAPQEAGITDSNES